MDEMTATFANFMPIILMVLIFYFLLYRPQKKAQEAAQAQTTQAPRFLLVNGVLRQVVPVEQAREFVQYNGNLWPIL